MSPYLILALFLIFRFIPFFRSINLIIVLLVHKHCRMQGVGIGWPNHCLIFFIISTLKLKFLIKQPIYDKLLLF